MELVDFREKAGFFLAALNKSFNKSLKRFRKRMRFFLEEKEFIRKAEPDLEEHLREAYQEWKNALEYFDNATEPELIDHASFLIGAAERKYMYLLRLYKESGQVGNYVLKGDR
ncbi:MAG: DUF2508 family protein [Halanaerobiales bacterium]